MCIKILVTESMNGVEKNRVRIVISFVVKGKTRGGKRK